MAMIPIENLGGVGVIKDRPAFSLPPNAWSDARNVRMNEGAVEKFLGHSQVFGTPMVEPHFLLPVQTTSAFYWMYASLTKVYVTDGATHTDLTRTTGGDYSANINDNWTGVVLGGIPVLNNGNDDPQMWSPVSTGTPLAKLTAWPASTTCKAMRAFKTFLFALNVTKSGTNYPRLVKWSHSSSFNSVPSSWDESDATLDAGEYELADTRGDVVDGLQLNDSFIIYKDDSIWGAQFVGAPLIFKFYNITDQVGIFSRRCIAEYEGGHFVFGHNDCVVTDGQTVRSVLDKTNRRFLYNSIDSDGYTRAFVIANRQRREIWICFPSHGSTHCDQALIWNWAENSFGHRDLPNVLDGKYGIADTSGTAADWANRAGTWDASAGSWDQKQYNPTQNSLIFAGTNDTKIYMADDTNQEDGSNMTAFVERTGLAIGSPNKVKMARRIVPHMESSGIVDIYVGGQMETEGPVSWTGPYQFDPSLDHKIDCRVNHRLLAIKFESDSSINWKLNSMEVDIVSAGET